MLDFIGNTLSTFTSNIFSFVFQVILNITLWFIHIVSNGFFSVVTAFVPQWQEYNESLFYYLSNYVFKGAAFAREVFLNITGFPRHLFNILIAFFVFKVGFMFSKIVIKFILNVYAEGLNPEHID